MGEVAPNVPLFKYNKTVLSSTQLKSTKSDASLLYSSFIGFNDGCSKTFLSDLILSNELPYANKNEEKNMVMHVEKKFADGLELLIILFADFINIDHLAIHRSLL